MNDEGKMTMAALLLFGKNPLRPIHYEGMQRVEPLEIPGKGLREILYNSIIHKSYDGPDNQMKVYDDRISLWNYGKMPEGTTISDMFKEHRSMPLLSLWKVEKVGVREGESVNSDKSAKGEKE